MKKINIILAALFFLLTSGVSAANLGFEPSSKTISSGSSFDATVFVDAGIDKILGSDIVIQYDSNLLEVEKVEAQSTENFLSFAREKHSVPGSIYIAGIATDPASEITGKGNIAKISFRAKANISGTTNIIFVCTPGVTAQDSNISQNSIDVKDIIVCNENIPLALSISGGAGSPGLVTSTPTPIGGVGAAFTPTRVPTRITVQNPPSTLPKTGVIEDMLAYGTLGMMLIIGGIFAKKYIS